MARSGAQAMIRWLLVWRLRRIQARLQSEIQWLRDELWSTRARLEKVEELERKVQANIWIAESPRYLLDPSRTASGGLIPRR